MLKFFTGSNKTNPPADSKEKNLLTEVFAIGSIQAILFYIAIAWFNLIGMILTVGGTYYLYNRYVKLCAILKNGDKSPETVSEKELSDAREIVNGVLKFNFNRLKERYESMSSSSSTKKE